MDDILYNTTFTLHRLSPLFTAFTTPLLSEQSLQTHSRRLSDALKGDVLLGVRVRISENERFNKYGALRSCQWSLIPVEGEAPGAGDDEQNTSHRALGTGIITGLKVVLEYEKITYVALLLRDVETSNGREGKAVYLPLMLIRMPIPVRDAFFDYLANTFDVRIEVLRLQSLGNHVEAYLSEIRKGGMDNLLHNVKDVQLVLGFQDPITPSLKNLDITIKKNDLPYFLKRGDVLSMGVSKPQKSKSLSNANDKRRGPFITALHRYINESLALDMDEECVFVSRVMCGCFVLGREGKAKIFAPDHGPEIAGTLKDPSSEAQSAVEGLLKRLIAEAKIDQLVPSIIQ